MPFSFGENGSFVAQAQAENEQSAWNRGNPFTWILIGMQKVVAWFTTGAISLLTQFIDAKLTTDLLTSTAVSEVWAAVRDVCNLAFILTLLFSAFATIFHIEKYHIKTIIAKLVLMALLINFSLPITRFIIDLGNVPMYYLAETMFGSSGASGIGGQIADQSNLVCVLVPHYGGCGNTTSWDYAINDPSLIIASTILLFLFCITIFSLAILFIIRTIGLTLLLMFSPIGFVGIAVPALNKYANEFWETLIKYVIFGPTMLFILAVSIKMMAAVNGFSNGGAGSLNLVFNGIDGFAKTIATLAPPIVVLWMGMAVAQKSSIAGASMVMGTAQEFAKKSGVFAARWGSGYTPFIEKTGIAGGVKNARDYWKKRGFLGSDAVARREAKVGGLLTKGGAGWTAAQKDFEKKQAAELEKDFKDNASTDTLRRKMARGSKAEKTAAARALASRDDIDDSEILKEALEATKHDANEMRYVLDRTNKKTASGMSGKELNEVYERINAFTASDDPTGTKTKDEREKMEKIIHSKLREERNIVAQVDAINLNTTISATDKDTKIKEIFGGLDPETIAKQNKALYKNTDFSDYLLDMATSGDPRSAKRIEEISRRVSQANAKALNDVVGGNVL